jgi:hypothetical protein
MTAEKGRAVEARRASSSRRFTLARGFESGVLPNSRTAERSNCRTPFVLGRRHDVRGGALEEGLDVLDGHGQAGLDDLGRHAGRVGGKEHVG